MSDTTFSDYLKRHIARIEPLSRDLHIAYWNATISGKKEDFTHYADLDIEYQTIYSNREDFANLKEWQQSGEINDPIESRQLNLLYRNYLRNQIDSELISSITNLSSDIVNKFNVYRTVVNGKTLSSNEVRVVLRESADSDYRRAVWEADKGVGPVVRDDLVKLVKLRNEAARSVGYDNYYSMSMELSEQKEDEMITLFDELADLTREPYSKLKSEVDEILASRCGVSAVDLRPWHYHDPFFQEAPRVFDLDIDKFYADKDVVEMSQNFFDSINLKTQKIIEQSDLYEKPGKEQHAYCMDIDRKGDIRVLANVVNDENWTGTMLHELGHAVYDLYIDETLPFLLREHAHIFATEAIAMLFGRLSKDPLWIQTMTGISDEERESVTEILTKSQRLSQLVFTRWCQVMVRFERALYKDPDQDLDALWWELVSEYQMMTKPGRRHAPDWASKIHIISAPVYYHNYMLGELLASQLDNHIQKNILGSGSGRKALTDVAAVGEYLVEKVFRAGKRYHWDELTRRATGEPLNPRYFVDQFVR